MSLIIGLIDLTTKTATDKTVQAKHKTNTAQATQEASSAAGVGKDMKTVISFWKNVYTYLKNYFPSAPYDWC